MLIKNLEMYCLTLNPRHLEIIKQLDYVPVGLGDSNFIGNEWLTDDGKFNIKNKNPYYGEYTFHYKLWKNNLLSSEKWMGFCQYRKFWVKKEIKDKNISLNDLKLNILQGISTDFEKYETIIGKNFYVDNLRFTKFIKKSFKKVLFQPSLLFNKKKRTIKFHFDMMHGDGNLDKAILLLDQNEKEDFKFFVNTETFFNPHNMFICKKKETLVKYYDSLFPWLERCETIFGFSNLNSYGLKRIYGFLAERYMSYWFKKYTKYYLMDIFFKDITDYIHSDL